jgi:hypothetical protein
MPHPVRIFVNSVEILLRFDACEILYTANLFLPFARRALMIFLPFFVFIRARKP